MKKITITLIAIFGLGMTQAQVAIGKSSVASPSVSLDFNDTEARGLLLPWVTGTGDVSGVVNGTVVFDTAENKVMVKYDSGWTDLSVQEGTTVNPNTNVDGLLIQANLTENSDAKVSIGTPDNTPGILVLTDTNKAMVLPKVSEPENNVINPTAGLMVYDTGRKALAVFNGEVWTYWKD